MQNDAHLIRAPQGAIAWTTADGWLYDGDPMPTTPDIGDLVLMVSPDGYLRGVTLHDRAPLASLLRIDADLAEVVRRIDHLADRAEGLDTSTAVEVAMLKGRVRRLEERSR